MEQVIKGLSLVFYLEVLGFRFNEIILMFIFWQKNVQELVGLFAIHSGCLDFTFKFFFTCLICFFASSIIFSYLLVKVFYFTTDCRYSTRETRSGGMVTLTFVKS